MARKNRFRIFSFLFGVMAICPGGSYASDTSQALAAYQAGRYQEAYQLWSPLAEQGDADAQFYLGLLYRNGQGVKQNDRQAL